MLKGIATCCVLAASASALGATTLVAPNGSIKLEVNPGNATGEIVSIKVRDKWLPALSAVQGATRVIASGATASTHPCQIDTVSSVPNGLVVQGDCGVGSFEQRILLTNEPDVLSVAVKFLPKTGVEIRSVEDRYDFAPGRRDANAPSGPVDFVWSQNIKNEADDIIPNWAFKSPVVMLQQGSVFTALMPELSDRRSDPLAMDLDVTSDTLPWLSYGAVPSQPYGHSYFRRSTSGGPRAVESMSKAGPWTGTIEYRYSIVASDQPYKLGYRRAVRRLWEDEGHKELMSSNDQQQNVLRPELVTFNDWASDTWVRYADEVYQGFDCGSRRCGTLVSLRNPLAEWNKQTGPDAWFNPWFQTLRTAYGWYLYGKRTDNKDIENKAESVLNLILTSPRNGGAFSTIYLLDSKRWIRSDGGSGFADAYQAFSMSWTAYWMLRWAEDITPDRKAEIMAFVRPYGDFLLKEQLSSGVIPSWYDGNLQPRSEFRDFNAETGASALFLASLAEATNNHAYLDAAEKAMDFTTREVLPRQRWFDFETFLSCARKPFSFYDPWTAQYPQNNMSQIQAAWAYLKVYQLTHKPEYLRVGTQVLDYLLLTQQVWNNPAFSPKLMGGFTTQNTDAEWSDAREAYAAMLLWDYYNATGRGEYLERAVAAARSTFAVAPWENWAHTGYIDQSGSLTGFHWGPGSGMVSIEMLMPALGDAFINVSNKTGAGFNACSIRNLKIKDHDISFDLDAFPASRTVTVKFAGVDKTAQYRITWNGNQSEPINGGSLISHGYTIRP